MSCYGVPSIVFIGVQWWRLITHGTVLWYTIWDNCITTFHRCFYSQPFHRFLSHWTDLCSVCPRWRWSPWSWGEGRTRTWEGRSSLQSRHSLLWCFLQERGAQMWGLRVRQGGGAPEVYMGGEESASILVMRPKPSFLADLPGMMCVELIYCMM